MKNVEPKKLLIILVDIRKILKTAIAKVATKYRNCDSDLQMVTSFIKHNKIGKAQS